MKNTGVVRRIDELGRIVIPKEIRKSLRIKEGESLEIFVEGDNVVLKKYSEMDGSFAIYNRFVDLFYSELKMNIIVTDRDKVLACAGDLKANYVNMSISFELEKLLNKRTTLSSRSFKNISLVNNNTIKVSYVIAPIIVKSDVIGSIVAFSSHREIDDIIVKMTSIGAKFLEKYIE